MQRRHFVKATTNMALALPWLPVENLSGSIGSDAHSAVELVEKLIKINDIKIAPKLASQILDKENRGYGGNPDRYGIPNAASSCALIRDLSCAYVSTSSEYYQSNKLVDAMVLASRFLLNIQHQDGTVDLHTTNFHSPPDTAFRVEPLALSYRLLNQAEPKPVEVLSNLQKFLLAAGKALAVGGIHTPNHRWVVCMALSHIHRLFPNKKYLQRVDQWLSEGIDIDPDGQYTEKSSIVYSPLVDRCLITVANLLDRPELFGPVRKNLEMTLYYIRPNYQVSTEASGRQDQYQIGTVAPYYYPYRFMALKDTNGQFSQVADIIESNEISSISHNLVYFLSDESMMSELPVKVPLSIDYVKYFEHSNLVRIRRNQRDATILAKNPLVFSYFKGSAALTGLRLASAFFGKGQFEGALIEINHNTYSLRQSLEGPYYQPLKTGEFHPEKDNFGEQRQLREQSEIQQLESVVAITEEPQGIFKINIQITGTENVPVALELGFRKGGELEGVAAIPEISDAYLLKEGEVKYTYDGHTITIGPGQAEHHWTQLRGALPKMEGPSVYLTGYTPLTWALKVE